MKKLIKVAATLFCLFLPVTPVFAGDVNLFAAASLKEVINELSGNFAKKHPGVKLVKNYGASGQLAK